MVSRIEATEHFRPLSIYLSMDKKETLAKIAELRDAAEQARALAVDLSAPEAEQGFVELARKMDEEASALERKLAGKSEDGHKKREQD